MARRKDKNEENLYWMYASSISPVIDSNPLLSAEDERDLLVRAQKGDKKARDRLVETNLRLVIKEAKAFRNRGIEFVDLIQEGNIGLMIAIDRFDVTQDVRLVTYAMNWIRQRMRLAILKSGKTIREPIHHQTMRYRLERARQGFIATHGYSPDDEELARFSGFSEKKVKAFRKRDLSVCSMTADSQGDPDSEMAERDIPDEELRSAEELVDLEMLKQEVRVAIVKMAELCLKYGDEKSMRDIKIFIDRVCEEVILNKIGAQHGISRERVRQITKKQGKKLRRLLLLQGFNADQIELS